MAIGLIGRKVGITQVFQEDGTMVAVSVLKVQPNTVTRLRTTDRDGYTAVQLGTEESRKLTKPELGQLKQRVTIHCRLVPLTDREVYPYILSRLKTAGYEGKALFDPKAVEKITLYSKGIPRSINVICDNALLNGFACSKKKISAEIVEETALDLQLTPHPPKTELSATAPAESQGKRRTIKEARPSASVLQMPLAEFEDFPMTGGERRIPIHRQRSLASLATGFVIGMFLIYEVAEGVLQRQSELEHEVMEHILEEKDLLTPSQKQKFYEIIVEQFSWGGLGVHDVRRDTRDRSVKPNAG